MPAPPATSEEFLELVRKSGVLSDTQFADGLKRLDDGAAVPPPEALAARMVDAGLLTRFQTQHLLQGKFRGFTIGGYRILELLGSGGMSAVYLCAPMGPGQPVAVKVLPRSLARDPVFLKRFYREARAATALNHPNLVRGYEVGQENDQHYFVMEFVHGHSLQQIVARTGPMALGRGAHYVRQAALGLQYAHEQGVVHRDIKPANLLVDRQGVVKVLDMGLALATNEEDSVLTRDVLGTLDYLAPEQARDSHAVDIRADIYSLGATFYFLLTGSAPLKHRPEVDPRIFGQRQWEPPPIRVVRPQVPEGLASIIATMLAFDMARRYQEPAEVVEALEPWTRVAVGPPAEAELPELSPAALRALEGETDKPSESGSRSWGWWPWSGRRS